MTSITDRTTYERQRAERNRRNDELFRRFIRTLEAAHRATMGSKMNFR